MTKFTDQQYLKSHQYRDSSNLDARVEIHQRFSTNPYGWFRWIFDILVNLPEDARILELGCGPGYLWKENINRIPASWNITLSDLSSGMLDAAWRNLVVTGRAFQFKEIDAQSIPFEEETFDAVIANHMLYHVPDHPKALAEMRRVLKGSGRLIATTVSESHMQEMMKWLRRVGKGDYVSQAIFTFTLENGFEQLRAFFSAVQLARYEDSLYVTEVEPIIAYIHSAISAADLKENELAELEQELSTRLKRDQGIGISKDSGLFEAVK